jgi:hypothetical protein
MLIRAVRNSPEKRLATGRNRQIRLPLRLMAVLTTLTFFFFGATRTQAQSDLSGATWKAAFGYTHNFPGMNGYTLAGEYIFPLAGQFEGGIGAKYAGLSGYPRTQLVNEYTKATTLDFNLYWVPLRSDAQLFRIGIGYSFSFYNIKRAYPLLSADGKSTEWPSYEDKGRATGINVIAEYEYQLPNSPFSFGLRGALYKAYDRTYFVGPVVGYKW